MSEPLKVPFFINGEVRFGNDVRHSSRDRGINFVTPKLVVEELVWPRTKPQPCYDLSVSEIIDFLVECGKAMDLDTNPHLREAIALSSAVNHVGAGVTERAYRGIRSSFDRGEMEFMIEQQLGSRFLDDWSPVERPDGTKDLVRAFPARKLLFLAGNGPGGSQNIVRCALTKGTSLLKVASSDLFTMVAVLRTMAEVGPAHPVVRSLNCVYWRGGDEQLESALIHPVHFDKIVAWGGESSMQHIRKYMGPGLDLVPFDPKTSISLIGREAFASEESLAQAVNLAATDVNLMNQDACVSSRFQFIEASIEEADRYCALLAQDLGKERVMGPGRGPGSGRDLREQVDGLRFMDPLFRVFGEQDGRGVVIRSEEPVDFHPDRKTVNVIPVTSIQDARHHVTVATQTVGVYPEHRKAEVRDALMDRGVQRVVPLGHAIGGPHIPHDAVYMLHRLVKWVVDETEPARTPAFLTPLGDAPRDLAVPEVA